MSGIPWIKWFPGDFLNGIVEMGPHEIAVYTVILNRIYDEDGPISDDPAKIARRCNMRLTSCEKALGELDRTGKIVRAEGLIDNNRAQIEREKRQKLSKKSASNAHTRWEKEREKPSKINDDAMQPHAGSNANSMQSRSQKLDKEDSPSLRSGECARATSEARILDREFNETFWPRYPHKVGKEGRAGARQAFHKARRKTPLADIMAGLDRYIAAKPHDRSWLNPSTFLNQARWIDEPADVAAPAARSPPPGNGFASIIRKRQEALHGQTPHHDKQIIDIEAEDLGTDGGGGAGRAAQPVGGVRRA